LAGRHRSGFPIASRGDLEAVQAVAREVRDAPSPLSLAPKSTILTPPSKPQAGGLISPSHFSCHFDLHLQVKLNMTRAQALEAIGSIDSLRPQHVGEVEFFRGRRGPHRNRLSLRCLQSCR